MLRNSKTKDATLIKVCTSLFVIPIEQLRHGIFGGISRFGGLKNDLSFAVIK